MFSAIVAMMGSRKKITHLGSMGMTGLSSGAV